jgi:SAM-dependent methyltransferase
MQEVNIKKPTDEVREFLKRWPTLYFLIVYIFGPAYLGYMSPRQFLKKFFPVQHQVGRILNLGSGPKRLRSDVINVDIGEYEQVDVVADLTKLPYEDGTVDGFVCDNVLEHVNDPSKALTEVLRTLKAGGIGYISTPFLYPFHASPYDYTRWTEQGIRVLLKDFEILQIGSRSGMFSSLNVWLCYLIPSLFSFGSDRLYWMLVNISLFIFFPIKFLDIFANHLPFAERTASVLFCVVRRKV